MRNADATIADRREFAHSLFPAYVVNLDSRPDRWLQVSQELAQLDWPATRWPASYYEKSPSKLSAGAAGCLESHRQIWRNALSKNQSAIAVFEDDVVFAGDFKDIFPAVLADTPADWDVLHLHSFRAGTEPITPLVVRFCTPGWGSHGYLITARACEKMLTFSPTMPVDFQLTQTLRKSGGRVYGASLACTLCFQRGDDSDIPASAQLNFWRRQRARYWRSAHEKDIHEKTGG